VLKLEQLMRICVLRPLLALLHLVVGATSVMAADAASSTPICSGLIPGPARTVVRVIDGETVELDDGSELRLIGALAPRAIDVGAEAGAWAPEVTTRDGLQALVLGKSVELAFGAEREDRYGRLQAHAYLIEGAQRRWVQGQMLAQGLARAYASASNRVCTGELLAAEQSAREMGRGLWSDAAYQVRRADETNQLPRYRSTFQIVEGRIVRVALVRGTIHLNFGRNWRREFSVSLRSADRVLLGPFANDPKALEGRHVRARGWVGVRNDVPTMDLSISGNLEVMANSGGEPGQSR
jgi:micrococcal nuclease